MSSVGGASYSISSSRATVIDIVIVNFSVMFALFLLHVDRGVGSKLKPVVQELDFTKVAVVQSKKAVLCRVGLSEN